MPGQFQYGNCPGIFCARDPHFGQMTGTFPAQPDIRPRSSEKPRFEQEDRNFRGIFPKWTQVSRPQPPGNSQPSRRPRKLLQIKIIFYSSTD